MNDFFNSSANIKSSLGVGLRAVNGAVVAAGEAVVVGTVATVDVSEGCVEVSILMN